MAPDLSRPLKGDSLANGDSDQGEYKRRRLCTMLALPVNKRRENNDYYGSVQEDLDRILILLSNTEHQADD